MASGRGGRRVGAGRKPKIALAPPPPERFTAPSTNSDAGGAEGCDECSAPDDLTAAERAVWLKLAPHAFRAKTLTKATAYQFELLCRNIVLERLLASSAETVGGSNHRGIIQRIDAELLRFDLAPNGKPHSAAVQAAPRAKTALELLREKQRGLAAVR